MRAPCDSARDGDVTDSTDEQLVSLARSGDRDAYGALVARYQGHVYGLAYSLVGRWADAQDIAQETFIRAYLNLEQLREPARFPAWLRRVAFSVAMRWMRTFRPALFEQLDGRVDLDVLEIPDFKPGPAEVVEKRELADAVQHALASLPPKYRVPLTMFHLDGLSVQKVADFLDIPLGSAKSLIHRARRKLKAALASYVAEEVTPMVEEVFDEHKLPPEFAEKVLAEVSADFRRYTSDLESHQIVMGTIVYPQPCVYLVTHLLEMQAAGWTDADFDTIAAVSGASALFGYQHGTYMPKYANLLIDMDGRIAEATGFGYEWVGFQDAEGAWAVVKESVDAGRPVKGMHFENLLIGGYREAPDKQDRRLFVMADGPETFADWWTWEQFEKWVGQWSEGRLGRHTRRVKALPPKDVALRVMGDLVEWSANPPEGVRSRHRAAKFGLEGIEAYAADCADTEKYEDWSVCHDVNPQWTLRNSTAAYLEGAATAGLFPEDVSKHVSAASREYRAAYEAWQVLYEQLSHGAPKDAGKTKKRRAAGAAAVRKALEHEKAGIAEIEKALSLIEES